MSSFPEEPLHLSPSEGGGYYPATIHQKLNNDKYEIVRKLGYGGTGKFARHVRSGAIRSCKWVASKKTVKHAFAIYV